MRSIRGKLVDFSSTLAKQSRARWTEPSSTPCIFYYLVWRRRKISSRLNHGWSLGFVKNKHLALDVRARLHHFRRDGLIWLDLFTCFERTSLVKLLSVTIRFASQVGHNSSAYAAFGCRSRTDAVICNWKRLKRPNDGWHGVRFWCLYLTPRTAKMSVRKEKSFIMAVTAADIRCLIRWNDSPWESHLSWWIAARGASLAWESTPATPSPLRSSRTGETTVVIASVHELAGG